MADQEAGADEVVIRERVIRTIESNYEQPRQTEAVDNRPQRKNDTPMDPYRMTGGQKVGTVAACLGAGLVVLALVVLLINPCLGSSACETRMDKQIAMEKERIDANKAVEQDRIGANKDVELARSTERKIVGVVAANAKTGVPSNVSGDNVTASENVGVANANSRAGMGSNSTAGGVNAVPAPAPAPAPQRTVAFAPPPRFEPASYREPPPAYGPMMGGERYYGSRYGHWGHQRVYRGTERVYRGTERVYRGSESVYRCSVAVNRRTGEKVVIGGDC
jgi:hypothetical protein